MRFIAQTQRRVMIQIEIKITEIVIIIMIMVDFNKVIIILHLCKLSQIKCIVN